MIDYSAYELWFVTGSQQLYGSEALDRVADDARHVVDAIDTAGSLPVKLVFKPVVTSPDQVAAVCQAANADPRCVGLVAWMHTFSPAKMWIAGLEALRRPLCHLHTQFGRDIPWSTIDMDFMNLHQSAHGGREFGYVCARLRKPRKVIVGHWKDPVALGQLAGWARAAVASADQRSLKVARLGDNMRHVAVTEGDKVEAQRRFGYQVHGYGLGDLEAHVHAVQGAEIDGLCDSYVRSYAVADGLRPGGERHGAIRDAARIELGLRAFLRSVDALALTDTFENLHGLQQLPGLAVQRLMADGYGFGAEGDWKTAALVRAMKVMAHGLPGGTSFMEDYTYHFHPDAMRVLGAHMLEVCPSIAADTPSLEVHPLAIGDREDPARLVFTGDAGPAVNASIVDMGNRFRLIVNSCVAVEPHENLPRLPVARVLWSPEPGLKTAVAAWIHAGGAHHTGYSRALTVEHLQDFADISGIECVVIDGDTELRELRNELRSNDVVFSS